MSLALKPLSRAAVAATSSHPVRAAATRATLLRHSQPQFGLASSLVRVPTHLPSLLVRRALTTSTAPAPTTRVPHSSSSSSGEQSSAPPPPPEHEEQLSRTQRLKALFRKHGWSALTIYLLLSLVDFGLSFLLIYAVGADKVRIAEDWVLDALGWRRKDGEPGKVKRAVDEWKEQHPRARKITPSVSLPEPPTQAELAQSGSNSYSAIASTAVLAYAIHKTLLLPVRIGLTAS